MTQLTQHSIDAGSERRSSLGDMSSDGTGGWSSNLSYLLVGGGIGAVVALLFAPKAGTQLRNDLGSVARKGYDGSLDMAQKMMDQSRDLYSTLKEKADQVTGGTASRIAGQAMDNVSNIADKTGFNAGSNDLPNGGGELLEGLSDSEGDRDKGSARGSNTGF